MERTGIVRVLIQWKELEYKAQDWYILTVGDATIVLKAVQGNASYVGDGCNIKGRVKYSSL